MPALGVYRKRPVRPTRRQSRRGRWVATKSSVGTLTITSPVANQFRWWGTARLSSVWTVSGNCTNRTGAVEVSYDNISWTTLDAATSGTTFTGTTTIPTGQWTLRVRYANATGVTASVTPISVGPVLAIGGQSNISGRGTNNQPLYAATGYTHGLKTATGYAPLADPYNTSVDPGSTGSPIPPMVTVLDQLLDAPIGIVAGAVGGTSITAWQAGQGNYIALIAAINAVGGCDGLIFQQGETDAIAGMTQATYHTNLASMIASFQTDIGRPVLVCTMPTMTQMSQANQDAINAAILAGWGDITGCKPGADLRSIPTQPEDPLHVKSDGKLGAFGAELAGTAYQGLYQPAGGGGGGGVNIFQSSVIRGLP